MIAVWGPSQSGKTALLAYLMLRMPPRESGWEVFATNESQEELDKRIREILKENKFPKGTDRTEAQAISVVFKHIQTSAQFQLETTDRAGSLSEEYDTTLLDSLVKSEGIVLFLDWGRGNPETEVIQTLIKLHAARAKAGQAEIGDKDPRPLAVCLSKVDEFVRGIDDFRRLEEKPEEFVKEKLSDELYRRIKQFHLNFQFFPVSSVGLQLHHGCLQKSVFYDETLQLRVTEGTPMNIVEPFIWIFDQLREAA